MSQDEIQKEILEFEELETQATQVEHSYTADDIQVLEGLEAVRLRPGMYIGSTSVRGLHHLVWEIVDNGIDEALAGFANRIDVTIEPEDIMAPFSFSTSAAFKIASFTSGSSPSPK